MTKVYLGSHYGYGDILCWTSIVKKVHSLFNNPEITFAIPKDKASIKPLLEQDPLIKKVFTTKYGWDDKLKEKCKGMDLQLLGKYRSSYLLGQWYELRGDDEIEEQAKHDIVFNTRYVRHDKEWYKKDMHQVQCYANCLGIKMRREECKIRAFPPDEYMVVDDFILFHNETAPFKQYKFFDELVKQIKLKYHYKIYILEKDKDNLDFIDIAQMTKHCKLFIGVDSAPIWLASAFDTPTIGLYGTGYFGEPTKNIYPINKNGVYLQSNNKEGCDVPADEVLKNVEMLLK